MATKKVVLTDRQAQLVERRDTEDELCLTALREAARLGLNDIEAGACRSFGSPQALDQFLASLTAETLDSMG